MAFRTYESLTQAAARTGLSVQDLRRSITAGELDAYRSGPRILRVDPIDVNMLRGQRHPMARIESTIEEQPDPVNDPTVLAPTEPRPSALGHNVKQGPLSQALLLRNEVRRPRRRRRHRRTER